MPNQAGNYQFPQKSSPLAQGDRGIASLTHNNRTFRFRTNPNEFRWTYTLNKRIDPTYGGRVIQLLGVNIDDFSFKAEAGGGGWEYMNSLSRFLRDIMVDQRNGDPATFEYTTRGWKLKAYVASVPFQDAFEEVLRGFEVQLKVQEDVSGKMGKNFLEAELRSLRDGVGFRRSKYNDPKKDGEILGDILGDGLGAIPLDALSQVVGYAGTQFITKSVGGS